MRIGNREIGPDAPVYIIAEISANHNQSFDEAVRLIDAAHAAGVDAVKLQTYTADTLTIDSPNSYFQVQGTVWEGKNLYQLYQEAFTPWEWQPRLLEYANSLGLQLFSSPFDPTAVDFLEEMGVPAFKVASFELVDIPLLRYIGKRQKPVILSTGMASLTEIEEAVAALRESGASDIALLKCTSGYPASPGEMNLRSIPVLAERFQLPVGLSDHTLGDYAAVAAVSLGARIIEKHITLDRKIPGPDSQFSLEPAEFKRLVDNVRLTEQALGSVFFGTSERESVSKIFRRSLFVVQDIKQGEQLTSNNVRSIRPGHGLAPKYLEQMIGRSAVTDIARGTPLAWAHVGLVKPAGERE